MKKKIVYFFVFILAFILQTSMLGVLMEQASVADAMLMLILAWSIIDGFFAFLPWAIFFGITYDLLTYSRVGMHALIFLGTVYFVSFFSRRFSVELRGMGVLLFLFFVIVVSIFSHSLIAGENLMELQSFHSFWKAFGSGGIMLKELMLNAFLFVMWFHVIKKIKNFFMLSA